MNNYNLLFNMILNTPSAQTVCAYLIFISTLSPITGHTTANVSDDRSTTVALTTPATRIISLSPHITELIYSLGAGDRIVATVEYSDFPPAAQKITRIGSAASVDMERILLLKPDLVLGWISGNRASDIKRLSQLGIPTFMIEPHELNDIPRHLLSIGRLLGLEATAHKAANNFTTRLHALRTKPKKAHRPRVFYQIWNPPLMTLGATHIINEAISLCGGENIYADVDALTATISIEDVLHRSPDVIIAGVVPMQSDPLTIWASYPNLNAVKKNALFMLNANEMHRPTLRMLDGIESLCDLLDEL